MKKNKKPVELPTTLSGWLRLSLVDLRKAKARGLRLKMSAWVRKEHRSEPCAVCMAGAVMVGTLGVAARGNKGPFEVFGEPSATAEAMFAINRMRFGDFEGAYNEYVFQTRGAQSASMAQQCALQSAQRVVRASYNSTGKCIARLADYEKAADILAEAGL